MANRNRGVEFFLKAKKVVATALIKDGKGWKLDVKVHRVCVGGKGHKIGKEKTRTFDLGKKSEHVLLLIIVPYGDEDSAVSCPRVVPQKDRGVTANLKVTITNTPPTGPPEVVEIDETDDDAQAHDGEDPE